MVVGYYNLLEGNTGSVTNQGFTGDRVAVVSDLFGTSYEKIGDAIDFTGAVIGDPHPDPYYVDSAITAISGECISTTAVKVTMSYSPMIGTPIDIQVGVGTSQAETNMDIDGKAIKVWYTYPLNYKDPLMSAMTEYQGKTLQKRIQATMLTIKKRELIPFETLVKLARDYVGTVNTGIWRGSAGTGQFTFDSYEGTWMCTNISGDFFDFYSGGEIYDTTYNFEFQSGGWDPTVTFIDPQGGLPVVKEEGDYWNDGESYTPELYSKVNFTPLTNDV